MSQAGAPTKYTPEMQEAADAYVDGGFVACEDVVPSKAGLSLELGVTRQTLTNWSKEHPSFLATLGRLLAYQERVSLAGGLSGKLNSTIVKLLLANHGYSDRQALDHTTAGQPMQSTQDAVLRALEAKHKK